MLRVSASALKSSGLKSRMLLQVHDELIFEAAPGELDALTSLVKTEMGSATSLRVPLEVSTGTGRSWAELSASWQKPPCTRSASASARGTTSGSFRSAGRPMCKSRHRIGRASG